MTAKISSYDSEPFFTTPTHLKESDYVYVLSNRLFK